MLLFTPWALSGNWLTGCTNGCRLASNWHSMHMKVIKTIIWEGTRWLESWCFYLSLFYRRTSVLDKMSVFISAQRSTWGSRSTVCSLETTPFHSCHYQPKTKQGNTSQGRDVMQRDNLVVSTQSLIQYCLSLTTWVQFPKCYPGICQANWYTAMQPKYLGDDRIYLGLFNHN